jgi:hypothetical protein
MKCAHSLKAEAMLNDGNCLHKNIAAADELFISMKQTPPNSLGCRVI